MTSEAFNNKADGTIRLVQAYDLGSALDILEGWGFEVLETGTAPSGQSGTARAYADVKLPAGWKAFGGFEPEDGMSYMDERGALRLSVVHRAAPQGRIPEHFNVSFYERFALESVVTERPGGRTISYDRSILRDQKTGEGFEIGPGMGFDTESKIRFTDIFSKTILGLFAADAGDEPEAQKIALAQLWDKDIKLDAGVAQVVRLLVLDKLYQSEMQQLAAKRDGLSPDFS